MIEVLHTMGAELFLAMIILVLLLLKISGNISNDRLLLITRVLLLGHCIVGLVYTEAGDLFGGLFHAGQFIVVQKNILYLGLLIIVCLFDEWYLMCRQLHEFLILMLAALLGMFFMLSAGNWLMFYLGLELATIPVAAMACFDFNKRLASEAGVKMILSAAFASAILLFGISLLYGATGTIAFNALPELVTITPLQVLAFVMLFAGFAFKLSVVPFHFWTADVYQGAPMPATAFLSVVSKAAFAFAFITALYKTFLPLNTIWYPLVTGLAIITMLVGNFFALRQQQLKRFLAFSSIAQVGFVLVGISSNQPEGIASVVYFMLIYTCSNLVAFGITSAVESSTGKTLLQDYKGLYQHNKLLSWTMALALFSLAGIPPTAGFFGKLFLIKAGAANASYLFVIVVVLNMVVSLYYYLKLVRQMFMEPSDAPVPYIPLHGTTKVTLLLATAGVLAIGFSGWLYDYIQTLSG